MGLLDYGILALIAALLGGAVWYIRRSKKQGKACIGCPDSGACSGCSGCKRN